VLRDEFPQYFNAVNIKYLHYIDATHHAVGEKSGRLTLVGENKYYLVNQHWGANKKGKGHGSKLFYHPHTTEMTMYVSAYRWGHDQWMNTAGVTFTVVTSGMYDAPEYLKQDYVKLAQMF
jgi:hypothetical protein